MHDLFRTGKRQRLPSPTAAPMAANRKAKRLPHRSRCEKKPARPPNSALELRETPALKDDDARSRVVPAAPPRAYSAPRHPWSSHSTFCPKNMIYAVIALEMQDST